METSPDLVYPEETSGTVMRVKFELILMQSAKVLNERSQHIQRAIRRPNG